MCRGWQTLGAGTSLVRALPTSDKAQDQPRSEERASPQGLLTLSSHTPKTLRSSGCYEDIGLDIPATVTTRKVSLFHMRWHNDYLNITCFTVAIREGGGREEEMPVANSSVTSFMAFL